MLVNDSTKNGIVYRLLRQEKIRNKCLGKRHIMNGLQKGLRKCKCQDRRCGGDRRAAVADSFTGNDRRSHQERRSGIKRRRHQRFQIEDFIFVNLKSESDTDVGQLIDISNGGLSFRYFVSAKKPKQFSKMDLELSGSDFAITGLPFRMISDTELTNGFKSSPIIFKRYSVQFERLTYDQNFKLCYFLHDHPLDRST